MSAQMNQEIATSATSAASAVASKALYGGASATGLAYIFSNEFLGLAGLVLAIGGFMVNLYYKHKEFVLRLAEDRRQQLEHEGRMEGMRK